MTALDLESGVVRQAEFIQSPNYDEREGGAGGGANIDVIIVHCISLPPGEYGGDCISRFFCNALEASEHPYFQSMAHLRVSSHFLIQRDGHLIQYVSTDKRAWHAGQSVCLGRPDANNFSIGIELEGLDTDTDGFTDPQYSRLNQLIATLRRVYPKIEDRNIFAHSDIAPGRKPDPGPYFDWARLVAPGHDSTA